MCLDHITDRNPKLNGVGYKLFSNFPIEPPYNGLKEGYHPPIQTGGDLMFPGTFYVDKNNLEILTLSENFYPAGFHIFQKLKDVIGWAPDSDAYSIWEVYYDNAQVIGNQYFFRGLHDGFHASIVVAKQITLMKRVK